MPHMLAMPRAFVAAKPAGGRARIEGGDEGRVVRFGAARGNPAGGEAKVGAVEIEADAPAQLGDLLFGEAGVGAGRAGLGAGEAIFDAAQKIRVGTVFLRMGGDHFRSKHRPVSLAARRIAIDAQGATPGRTMAAPAPPSPRLARPTHAAAAPKP